MDVSVLGATIVGYGIYRLAYLVLAPLALAVENTGYSTDGGIVSANVCWCTAQYRPHAHATSRLRL